MSFIDRLRRIQAEQEREAQEKERQRKEALAAQNQEAQLQQLKAQRILEESGAVRGILGLKQIEPTSLPTEMKPHNGLSIDQPGSAKIAWDHHRETSGSLDLQASIEIKADPITDSITINGDSIPASTWRTNPDAVEDAIAKAYLKPIVRHHPPLSGSSSSSDINLEGIHTDTGEGGSCCHCLSKGSLISTPDGEIKVENLKGGDFVWSTNSNGKRVKSKIIKVAKVSVKSIHQMLKITTIDYKTITVSPEHPNKNGVPLIKALQNLELGEMKIKNIELVKYENKFTYDILPAGKTGNYWVNGVLLGSTLSSNFRHELAHLT